jgi:hypothetical protein
VKEVVMRYVYSVIRFVPDPARGEFVNVAAIVGSEESSEWQVRQIENPKRARFIDDRRTLPIVWSFVDDIGRVVDDHEEAVNRLLDTPVELSEAWLKKLYVEHRNVVQLSAPTPMVASNAEEALDRVFEELVVDPARIRRGTPNKHTALAAVRRSYRDYNIGKDNLWERVTLETRHHHREKVDFAVANGRVVQLTHTWSFQVANQDELAEQIKAWGWTIRDAREHGGTLLIPHTPVLEVDEGVDIEVVYVQPNHGDSAPAWEDAQSVFEALGARFIPIEEANRVGQEAHKLLAESVY